MAKKPRIVIIGAGMAGLTAANKLYTSTGSDHLFELVVVEGGDRIGGRINTSEFCGDRIEMGATWIHGIGGSPVHQIAREIHALESDKPWECMDGFSGEPKTIAEGGFELNASIVDPISTLFKNLMDFAQGKLTEDSAGSGGDACYYNFAAKAALKDCTSNGGFGNQSVGAFLRRGLGAYWDSCKDREELNGYGKWSRKLLEEAVFAMHENTQRTYTSAGDLFNLDYEAESEYRMFPGEEITISKGYLSIIEHLASVLPPGVIQLGRKVTRIEWQPEGHKSIQVPNGYDSRPVKIEFCDGSFMLADHVIVTVSLGVLKSGTGQDSAQKYKPFVSRCVLQGDLQIGSVREVNVKSGLPATTSTERLEYLDDDEHILSMRIVGGDHRLKNYSSIVTVHPKVIDGRPGTLVIESFVVDVPEGNTKDETCYFVEALIKCNLKSLADVSERLAVQDRTEPIERM